MLSGDEKLVERCLRGEDAAWETIVRAYGKRIYNLAYRYTGRKEEAEDLTQEAFIRIYQNLKAYRPEAGSFQNWLLTVSRNVIVDHYRQSRRFRQTGGSEEIETLNLGDDRLPDPQLAAERQEAAHFLHEGLQSLPVELKEALILRDIEGMAYEDIARLMAIPEGTVKSRINRGRLELAKLLTRRRAQSGMGL